MKEKKYKDTITAKVQNILANICVLGMIVGIWIPEYRWRIITTFIIGICILFGSYCGNEKSFNEPD